MSTKLGIAKQLAKIPGITQEKGVEAVKVIFKEISKALKKGETVKIKGFYNFSTRFKSARKARNPRTDEPAMISARTVVKAKASQELRNRINSN